jgi:hypothetical protein
VNSASRPTSTTAKKPLWSRSRGWWLRHLHTWHWISAAVSLVGMMLFALTGLTLNHAGAINAAPVVRDMKANLPPPLLPALARAAEAKATLPAPVARHIVATLDIDTAGRPVEWSDGEAYVALPRPGGDAWVSIDRTTGAITAETTDRGWVSYLNDLHKGRNAGTPWFWFIDAFAVACLIFTLTGMVILQLHARNRRSTWPLVGAGLAIPVLIAILTIH